MRVPIKLANREVSPHKAVIAPHFGIKTVLTNSPWTFVGLWLKRNQKDNALFYWEQAELFYKASNGLPPQSAPLLLYYSFLNSVKALLSSKGIVFDEHHGVREDRSRRNNSSGLTKHRVRILSRGVARSLATYYNEPETVSSHGLSELFYNMPFIHRTYCITHSSHKEMFVPLRKCRFVFDTTTSEVFLTAELSEHFSLARLARRLPASFIVDSKPNTIRSTASISWRSTTNPNAAELNALVNLQSLLRNDMYYINGSHTLWYLKLLSTHPQRLMRQNTTLMLTAMHRLSELSRYEPLELRALLNGQKNWLLSEFVQMAPVQFIDEIAAEITGHQCLIPNIRAAT